MTLFPPAAARSPQKLPEPDLRPAFPFFAPQNFLNQSCDLPFPGTQLLVNDSVFADNEVRLPASCWCLACVAAGGRWARACSSCQAAALCGGGTAERPARIHALQAGYGAAIYTWRTTVGIEGSQLLRNWAFGG